MTCRRCSERTAEILDDINLSHRRDVPAGLLTYAEQRELEIGITIAGGAGVIMLDEPTAGMSHAETERAVALIRRLTEGRTLVIVEHDMSVVFGLADRISVLVYGQIIASGTPRGNPRQCQGQGSLSRRGGSLMLEVRDLHAYYGKSHILQGVDLDIAAGEVVSLLGRNGVGRSTTVKAIMGEVPPQGTIRFKGQEIAGLPSYKIARLRLGLCAGASRYLSRADRAAKSPARRQEHSPSGQMADRRHARDVSSISPHAPIRRPGSCRAARSRC